MRGVTIEIFIFLCLFKGFLWPPFEKIFENISCVVAAHASYMHVVFLTVQWLLGSTIMFPLSNVAILIILAEEYSQVLLENNKNFHIMCISCPIRTPNGLMCRKDKHER